MHIDLAALVDDSTALHHAVRFGQPEIAAILLDNGADINKRDKEGQTALIAAVHSNQPKCVKLLLERKADTTASATAGEFQDKTALDIAEERKLDAVLTVLQAHFKSFVADRYRLDKVPQRNSSDRSQVLSARDECTGKLVILKFRSAVFEAEHKRVSTCTGFAWTVILVLLELSAQEVANYELLRGCAGSAEMLESRLDVSAIGACAFLRRRRVLIVLLAFLGSGDDSRSHMLVLEQGLDNLQSCARDQRLAKTGAVPFLFKMMAECVQQIHSKQACRVQVTAIAQPRIVLQLVWGDLKLENFVLFNSLPSKSLPTLKAVDFESAVKVGQPLTDAFSRECVPPERAKWTSSEQKHALIARKSYDSACLNSV